MKTLSKLIYEQKISNKLTNKQKISKVKEIFINFLNKYMRFLIKRDPTFPYLSVTSFELKESRDKKKFFINVTTTPYNNHPFCVFGNYDDNKLFIIIPLGNKFGQINIRDINKNINSFNILEKEALYRMLKFTLKIREFNFVKPVNSNSFKCANIRECEKEIQHYVKLNRPYDYNKIYNKHLKQIFAIIKIYFKMLKDKEYKEAKLYLTRDTNNNKKKFICLKNLFYNSNDIIGHLLIFIDIYKCLDKIKESI